MGTCNHRHTTHEIIHKDRSALEEYERNLESVSPRIPKFRAAIMRYIKGISRQLSDETLEMAVITGDATAIVGLLTGLPYPNPSYVEKTYDEMVELEEVVGAVMVAQIVGAAMATGTASYQSVVASTSAAVSQRPLGARVVGSFTINNPYVVPEARERVGWLIHEVRNSVDMGLRDRVADIIEDAYTNQYTTAQAGRQLRKAIGLRPDQVASLQRLERKLAAQGVTGSKLSRRMEREATKKLNYRASMIARTEVARAVSSGRVASWKVAQQNGLFTKASVEWVAGLTDRTCMVCANLHGMREPLGEMFMGSADIQGELAVMGEAPPIHPNCRCTVILRIEQ